MTVTILTVDDSRTMRDMLRMALVDAGFRVVQAEGGIVATVSDKPKCIRCWHHRDDVGRHPDHPEICGRCVSNVEGPGEARQWF